MRGRIHQSVVLRKAIAISLVLSAMGDLLQEDNDLLI